MDSQIVITTRASSTVMLNDYLLESDLPMWLKIFRFAYEYRMMKIVSINDKGSTPMWLFLVWRLIHLRVCRRL